MKKLEMLAVALLAPAVFAGENVFEGPWRGKGLEKAPAWHRASEFDEDGVQAGFLESVPWKGRPTRFFAFYALPKGASPEHPVPGVVLVHGGGGTAFAKFVKFWNERGFAAISMDNCGSIPHVQEGKPGGGEFSVFWKRHAWSGPSGWENGIDGSGLSLEDQWTYHAVATVLLSHSFLASLPGVDAARIGVSGVSWGGYLTCIAGAADHRFRWANPIYGCGFLGDHSGWQRNGKLKSPEGRRFLELWDPSVFLPRATCPFLWTSGTDDFAYPIDSLLRSAALVKKSHFDVSDHLAHGHTPGFLMPKTLAFAKAVNAGEDFPADPPKAWLAEAGVADGRVAFHRLWYAQPAEDSIEGWERQSLPIGCGHFGVSVFGNVAHERLQVTHNAVLTGAGGGRRANLTNALEVRLDVDYPEMAACSRGLDIERGIAWAQGQTWDNRLRHECFASYPARALVLRLTATRPGGLTFRLRPEIPNQYAFAAGGRRGDYGRRGTVVAKDGSIAVDQELECFGVKFAGRFSVVAEGGRVTSAGDTVAVSNANAAVVYFTCDTNYRLAPETFSSAPEKKLDPHDDPGSRAEALLAVAKAKGWQALRAEHLADMASLMGRAAVSLGAEANDALVPTDRLLADYAKGRRSRYLEEAYWQYGRYLLVASSRPGSLPANLQGVWTAHNASPWGSGYWHNINVQMNYWPAFSANLAECFLPYAEFNAAFRPTTRRFALDYLRAHGRPVPADGEAPDLWCVGTAVWPYVVEGGPGGHSGPGTGGLTTKLFADWYDFTLDRRALEKYVWPTVHGMAEFLTRCVTETNGLYLSAFSASPEQMRGKAEDSWEWSCGKPAPYYTTVGCAFDQQMIWENGHDLLRLAKVLGREDDPVVQTVRRQLDKYDPVQIGVSGQIKEFREENAYGEIGQLHHRHISQLVGLMPGTLITRKTPAWLAAARKTLDYRGDESTGWALAHRLNARARAGDGERAYALLANLLSKRTFDNLWDAHPPFQIDGNFGATAGVAEMLMQSHVDGIDLLPALPKAWAKEGAFRGLRARGGYEVDCRWRDGAPVEVTIRSASGQPPPDVRFNGAAVPCAVTMR